MRGPRLASRSRRGPLPWLRLPLALLLCLPGCFAWEPVDLAPRPRFGPGASVRVEDHDGNRTILIRPEIVGDSLVGDPARSWMPGAVAFADIRRAWDYRFSASRTVALGLFVAVGVAVLIDAIESGMPSLPSGFMIGS